MKESSLKIGINNSSHPTKRFHANEEKSIFTMLRLKIFIIKCVVMAGANFSHALNARINLFSRTRRHMSKVSAGKGNKSN